MSDRINIDSELSRLYEGIVLKKKIDQGQKITLLDESMIDIYRSLLEHAMKYDSINTMLPIMLLKY